MTFETIERDRKTTGLGSWYSVFIKHTQTFID